MNNTVTIIDYGLGNLLSIRRAFEYFGADVVVTADPVTAEKADRLILPGVGAFPEGMNRLAAAEFPSALRNFMLKNRPFLGICLGMQILLESSEEFGTHKGLGSIGGTVDAIPPVGRNGVKHKIPHVGWNALHPSQGWDNTILREVKQGEYFYFVHSFSVHTVQKEETLAVCDYDGIEIAAVICKGMVYGCQFHPEKSGQAGLKIIKAFLSL